MALTKLQYEAFLNWNYNILKDIWNTKFALPFSLPSVASIDDWWNDLIVSLDNWSFFTYSKDTIKRYILYLDKINTSIEFWSYVKTASLASSSSSLRRWTGIKCPISTENNLMILAWRIVDTEFICRPRLYSENISRASYNYGLIETTNLSPDRQTHHNDKLNKMNELLSSWDDYDYDAVERNLNSVVDLWFVKDITFEWWNILFKIREYDMWLWYGYVIHMPDITIKYHTELWVCSWNGSYYHPHISPTWNICLWTAQDAINKNKFNFELLMLTLYEILCTYNRLSPYFNIRSRDFLNFVVRNWWYLKYEWVEYNNVDEIVRIIESASATIY